MCYEAILYWHGHCRGQCIEARIDDPQKIFNLHFSVVWIGSRSTFVLCIALLTGTDYHSLKLATLWALLTVTVML